jgi:hypothetical protein
MSYRNTWMQSTTAASAPHKGANIMAIKEQITKPVREIRRKDVVAAMSLDQDDYSALSAAEKKAFWDLQDDIVFGHNHVKDKLGRPIEMGIGSAMQETANSKAALARESYYRNWAPPGGDAA